MRKPNIDKYGEWLNELKGPGILAMGPKSPIFQQFKNTEKIRIEKAEIIKKAIESFDKEYPDRGDFGKVTFINDFENFIRSPHEPDQLKVLFVTDAEKIIL